MIAKLISRRFTSLCELQHEVIGSFSESFASMTRFRGEFMNRRARSPSHGIHCWMIFGSKRKCYGQSLRQAIWCTASRFHTHTSLCVVLSFSSRHVLLETILRIERFIALFCAIKALRGSELFYSVEAKIAEHFGHTSPSRQQIFHVRSESSSRCDALSRKLRVGKLHNSTPRNNPNHVKWQNSIASRYS